MKKDAAELKEKHGAQEKLLEQAAFKGMTRKEELEEEFEELAEEQDKGDEAYAKKNLHIHACLAGLEVGSLGRKKARRTLLHHQNGRARASETYRQCVCVGHD